GKNIHERGGRLPEMKTRRVVVTVGVVAALVAAVLLVPLPISRIRQTGLVQFQPDAMEQGFLPLPGTLGALYVRDGRWVGEGPVRGGSRNREMENQLERTRTDLAVRILQLRALREYSADAPPTPARDRVAGNVAQLEGERQFYAQQVEVQE